MESDARMYIMHRFKTMSHYSGCLPYEYPPHLIRNDMEKASFFILPSENEIEEVLISAKLYAKNRILSMLKAGRSISEVREWCEYSLDCPIPIPSVGSVRMDDLLNRFDYFNYEVNRMFREEQIAITLNERKKRGVLFDLSKMPYEFEDAGISATSDEFTRIEILSNDELEDIIKEAEENSDQIILGYLYEDLDKEGVIKKAGSNVNIVYSDEELKVVVNDMIRKERFRIISREVVRMANSELWNLINTVEAFRLWKLAGQQPENPYENGSPDNQMLEMLKIYEQSGDSFQDGYLFQLSKLNVADLSKLLRLMNGYIIWKSSFHYVSTEKPAISASDLSRKIIDGFAQEHGVDPMLFHLFLIR